MALARQTFAWCAGSAAATIVAGWIAFQLQQVDLLPSLLWPILFPLVLGGIVGGCCGAIAARLRIRDLRWIVPVAALAGVGAVLVQESFAFGTYRRQFETMADRDAKFRFFQAAEPQLAPAGFHRFVWTRVRNDPFYWTIDAILTIFASIVLAPAMARPLPSGRRLDGQPAGDQATS